MNLKKLGFDNATDGATTVFAGVTFVNVILRFWKLPPWFADWDYVALATLAVCVVCSWLANFWHRQRVELIREHAEAKTLNILSGFARSSVFWTCMAAMQALTFVHRH
jgi:hypothetical protein